MDIKAMVKVKQAWDTFLRNHPKFPIFANAVKEKGITEGTEIRVELTYPDGQEMKVALKVKASDLEMVELLKTIQG
jgi:hypothetical protein